MSHKLSKICLEKVSQTTEHVSTWAYRFRGHVVGERGRHHYVIRNGPTPLAGMGCH
jgi:hypothetical protein